MAAATIFGIKRHAGDYNGDRPKPHQKTSIGACGAPEYNSLAMKPARPGVFAVQYCLQG